MFLRLLPVCWPGYHISGHVPGYDSDSRGHHMRKPTDTGRWQARALVQRTKRRVELVCVDVRRDGEAPKMETSQRFHKH